MGGIEGLHELDDIHGAKTWLSKEKVRKKVAAQRKHALEQLYGC